MEDQKIQTREEHEKFLRKIWTWCIVGAVLVFLLTGGIVLSLFLAGYDSKRVVEISTSIFQVIVLSYGLGFFVPAFITSLTKLSLGIEMSRRSLDLGNDTVGTMKEVKDEIKPVISDLRHIADRLEQSVVKDGILEKVEGHMKAIRDRLERDTKPLENPQRRDRSATPAAPESPTVSLEDIERMEDALASDDFDAWGA